MPVPPRPIKRARFALESAAGATLLGLGRITPRPLLKLIGETVGEIAYRLSRRHNRVALDNLTHAFGDALDDRGRRRILRACWRHYGRITVDAAAFPRLSAADIGTLVRYEGLDMLRAVYAEGKGVLMMSGHFGHWELAAYVQALAGLPLLLIARTLDNPRLNAMVDQLRCGSGNVVSPKSNAVRALIKALQDGIGIAVMIDQDARGAGVFVPFFGRKASTISTIGTMHLRSGVPVVAAFCYPEPDGGWRIVLERLEFTGLTGDREADVLRITAQTTALLEKRIRERPELWLWMHRRWKTAPPAA